MVSCIVLYSAFVFLCNSTTTDLQVTKTVLGRSLHIIFKGLHGLLTSTTVRVKRCLIIPCLFCLRCDSEIPAVAGFPSEHNNNRSQTILATLMRVTDG